MQPTKNISDFHHIYKVKVKFNEVDMLHIVKNSVYFTYFEQARIQYAKDAGLLPDDNIFSEESLYYMVHNEINYLKPAFFDDDLNIYTRISYIKHSSFGFEHIVENSKSKKIIAVTDLFRQTIIDQSLTFGAFAEIGVIHRFNSKIIVTPYLVSVLERLPGMGMNALAVKIVPGVLNDLLNNFFICIA